MLKISKPKLDVETVIEQIKNEIEINRIGVNKLTDEFLEIELSSKLEYIKALIANAETFSQTKIQWPNKLNFFPFNITVIQNFILKIYGFIFKKQSVVNNSLIQGFQTSLVLNEQLISQINYFTESLQNVTEQIQLEKQRLSDTQERLSDTQQRLSDTQERLLDTQERLSDTQQRLSDTQERLSDTEQNSLIHNAYIKNDLNQQKLLMMDLMNKLTVKNVPDNLKFDGLKENSHLLDAFYVALEDKFRGTREDIFERLKVYLPFIKNANIGTEDAPILDVGCGRGEWLELLQNNGCSATGIDINRVMIEQCQGRGLKVIEADVIEYLKSLPEQSLGGISGFHIIEHLPFEILLELFSETVRVLKKGGIVIFETPNPQNILVASYTFYTDPTHLHPLPRELVKFIAELQGLSKIQILNLHPYPEHLFLKGSEVAERLNQHFYSAQDYSIIGYKA